MCKCNYEWVCNQLRINLIIRTRTRLISAVHITILTKPPTSLCRYTAGCTWRATLRGGVNRMMSLQQTKGCEPRTRVECGNLMWGYFWIELLSTSQDPFPNQEGYSVSPYSREIIFPLWLYSPILGLGRLHETFYFISVTRSRTVSRTPWTCDQLVTRPLHVCPRWLWGWRSWWNERFWQGKPKYSEKTCPKATLSTINPTFQTQARTRATAVGSEWLTASAVARPLFTWNTSAKWPEIYTIPNEKTFEGGRCPGV
jgi:hypothetical protein